MPNPVFGRNPVFAVREQLTEFRRKLRSDSETSWSKVYPPEWNPCFFFEIQNTLCETHPFRNYHSAFAGTLSLFAIFGEKSNNQYAGDFWWFINGSFRNDYSAFAGNFPS